MAWEASAGRPPLQLHETEGGLGQAATGRTPVRRTPVTTACLSPGGCLCLQLGEDQSGLAIVITEDGDPVPHGCPVIYFKVNCNRCMVTNCSNRKSILKYMTGRP